MATIKLIPSTYSRSNSTYLSVTNAENMYTNTSSATYATVQNTRASTTSYYIYIKGFNFSSIPSNATINSFTVKFKAKESGVTTSTSYRPYLVNNTTTITGSCSTIGTTATTYTFTGVTASWDTIKGYGSNFGIRINCRRASSGTTAYMYIYGAEILVDYTIPTKTVNTTVTNGTLVSPTSSTITCGVGDSYPSFVAKPYLGYTLDYMTINDTNVTPTESTLGGAVLYHFDNTVIADDYGNSTTSGSAVTSHPQTGGGKYGGFGLYLDGSSYLKIDLNSDVITDQSKVTVECWFMVTAENTSGKYPTLFSTEATGTYGGTYMHIDDGGYSTTCVCRSNATAGTSNNGSYGEMTITRNTWHYFRYIRWNNIHYFSIDGVQQAEVTQDDPNDINTIYLGVLKKGSGFDANTYMTGYIDELVISNGAKGTAEVPEGAYTTESANASTYTYNSSNTITTDLNVVIAFKQKAPTRYITIKNNGSWDTYTTAYKKINGSWVLQSDLSTVFSSDINWVRGD